MVLCDDLAIEKAVAASHVRRLRGRDALLAHQALLREFAASTGQHATMHGLEFELENEYARRKTPHLVCVVAGGDASATLTIDSLLGCVLYFEYRIGAWHSGFFTTGDSTGVGTVVAPVSSRARVAALAAEQMLREGQMVLTCLRTQSSELPEISFSPGVKGLCAAQVRPVRDLLRLQTSYDLTLATMGKRTRTHLRYYRRRVEAETGCVFVAEAAPRIASSELARLNASSLDPVSQHAFDLQFQVAAQVPGGYICGLRAADGRWLSLAGGWRQGNASLLQWQMNASGFRKFSLSTALRAYLIEHEVSLGTTELRFHHGTSHSLGHAFQPGYAADLLLRRRGPLPALFVRLIPFFAERDPALARRGNFLVDALHGRNLHWRPIN